MMVRKPPRSNSQRSRDEAEEATLQEPVSGLFLRKSWFEKGNQIP
jgi:hypothetical protein